MGSGMDRAGYKQIAGMVDGTYITDTMGATTCPDPQGWGQLHLLTDSVVITGITAPGLANSSIISSNTTYSGYGTNWMCSKITMVNVKTGTVIARKVILL
ncbi:MAG: hypothetical protein ACYTBZ_28600 [Planctomycetota bacterium]|jgi:hypothetical protein